MSSMSSSRAPPRGRYAAPEPRRVEWQAVAIALAILGQAGTGIWYAATLNRRVAGIEEQLPPGAISRLDERTLQIQKALDRLERRP